MNAFYKIPILYFKYQILYTCKLTSLSWQKSTQLREGAFSLGNEWKNEVKMTQNELFSIFKSEHYLSVHFAYLYHHPKLHPYLFKLNFIGDVVDIRCITIYSTRTILKETKAKKPLLLSISPPFTKIIIIIIIINKHNWNVDGMNWNS